MRLEITAQLPQFNAKGYINQYFRDLKQQYFLAASDFLNAAGQAVPIDTGMARGSFINLLNLLEANNIPISVDIPREPIHVHKDGTPFTYTHYDGSKFDKTPASGAALSTNTKRIITQVGDKLMFTYETEVWHYKVNENDLAWFSYIKGRDAFEKRMNRFVPPNPSTFMRLVNWISGKSTSPTITYVRS